MSTTRHLSLLMCLAISSSLAGSAQADDLGQLFTNASERVRIDALRAGTPQETTTGAPAERLVVNGTLRGSDGKRLVWLNGTAVNPDSANDMTLMRDGRVQLSWRDGKRIVKPGQGVDQASGEIFEHYTPVPVPAPAATTKETETSANTEVAAAIPDATAKETVDTKSVAPDPKTKPK